MQRKESFFKMQGVARAEVDEMAEYLNASDQKQYGKQTLLRGTSQKFPLSNLLVALTNRTKELEKAIGESVKKKPGRPKKVDGADKPGEKGQEKLEGSV